MLYIVIYTECCGANTGCGSDNTCCVNDEMDDFFDGASLLLECTTNSDCCNPGSVCQSQGICECFPLGYYI